MSVTKLCRTCSTPFTLPPSQARLRVHCSKECQKRRTSYACEGCGKVREVRPSETAKRFCGDECRLRWFSQEFRADRSPHWKGGEVPYYGPSWRAQRRLARERAGGRCEHCGVPSESLGEALSVAHVVPFRAFGLRRHLEANDLSNLKALCRSCHLEHDWANGHRA